MGSLLFAERGLHRSQDRCGEMSHVLANKLCCQRIVRAANPNLFPEAFESTKTEKQILHPRTTGGGGNRIYTHSVQHGSSQEASADGANSFKGSWVLPY